MIGMFVPLLVIDRGERNTAATVAEMMVELP
jgi:hypothetical protein